MDSALYETWYEITVEKYGMTWSRIHATLLPWLMLGKMDEWKSIDDQY